MDKIRTLADYYHVAAEVDSAAAINQSTVGGGKLTLIAGAGSDGVVADCFMSRTNEIPEWSTVHSCSSFMATILHSVARLTRRGHHYILCQIAITARDGIFSLVLEYQNNTYCGR